MKKIISIFIGILIASQLLLFAEIPAKLPSVYYDNVAIPANYYDSAAGKNGYELKTALFNIIKNPSVTNYKGLWKSFKSTDTKNDTIRDMYTLPGLKGLQPFFYFIYKKDQCGTYKKEGDCYNREHSFPASWFKDANPMYTDLFHIYPTDGKINSIRSNYPYGVVNGTQLSALSQNGSKKGYMTKATTSLNQDIIVFEPIDEYKGDFARTYFYMATCYQDKIAGWENNTTYSKQVLAGNDSTVYQDWYVKLLLKWHKNDPVSQKEIDRNDAVYAIQKNRNPYIDSAQFVNRIWGQP